MKHSFFRVGTVGVVGVATEPWGKMIFLAISQPACTDVWTCSALDQVAKYLAARTEDEDDLWFVKYTDGDSEHMDKEEVREVCPWSWAAAVAALMRRTGSRGSNGGRRAGMLESQEQESRRRGEPKPWSCGSAGTLMMAHLAAPTRSGTLHYSLASHDVERVVYASVQRRIPARKRSVQSSLP